MSTMNLVVPPPPLTVLPVMGGGDATQPPMFPVRRVYCIGRNYADHVREMGADPSQEPPCFFTKPANAVVFCSDDGTTEIPYALATQNLHYEIELVVAIGKTTRHVPSDLLMECVYGLAVGCDLTRRDLQVLAKEKGLPWDSAKAFDQSAPMGKVYPVKSINDARQLLEDSRIWLCVNGQERQSGNLNQMIWSVPKIICALAEQFELMPGDLIMTGTPSGVGPLQIGDTVSGGVETLGDISFQVTARD